MRTRIFRQTSLLVGSAQVIALKDVDGADPLDLFLENVDNPASLRTPNGDKNAGVLFTAKIGVTTDPYNVGTPEEGNDISVTITTAPKQAFSVTTNAGPYTPYGAAVVINLRCAADGTPNQLASEVIDLLNANAGFSSILVASRAPGSDGSAHMAAMSLTYLSGGLSATAIATVSVEYAPTGAESGFPGPWVTLAAAGSALSTVAANSVKSYSIVDTPLRGLRVKADKGSQSTTVIVTGIARKKSV